MKIERRTNGQNWHRKRLAVLVSPLSNKIGWLNLACVVSFTGIWIEKGMGLIIPAFIPTPLGQIVEYTPTLNETLVCIGIWAFGLLLYTLMLKTAIPVLTGKLNFEPKVKARSAS